MSLPSVTSKLVECSVQLQVVDFMERSNQLNPSTLFHQWGIKKQVPKYEYFCVHPLKDTTNFFLAQQSEANTQYSRLTGCGVTLCRWFVLNTLCVECTVCLLWKKLHRIELHKYCKNTSWTVGGRACLLKDTVYTTRLDLESLDLVYTF